MWQDFATALCLVLVIEGIIPFLAPGRWRSLAARLALVDDRTIRMLGFASMICGVALLYVVN